MEPFTKSRLEQLLKKAKVKPSEVLRKRAKEYKELDYKNKNYTEKQILGHLVKHPDLLERPIVEKGTKAVLARPIEKVDDLF
ncbi:MAG: ArsC/Spx/MgsR family protein [Melioribacteraceae bacterium]|nr:ArsC/Spx/MgsR family protein [Melioribacteraceae bacterium]